MSVKMMPPTVVLFRVVIVVVVRFAVLFKRWSTFFLQGVIFPDERKRNGELLLYFTHIPAYPGQ